ncbi:epidermal retinol dehydrogenase 2 isoform X2 [Hydra vulgaris]|uniref:epidermal retinol dehydrogenase 2 isoform X2 n=1 Tax=Hydra vulgaris TaxID=6087 RepID=UPI001F5E57D2|nr:epidermal retinol dehydrogenase 2 [Hydra vulgaris]
MILLDAFNFLLVFCCCIFLSYIFFYLNADSVKWLACTAKDFLCAIFMTIIYILKAWFNFFYAYHKDLKNEIVLLTGASGGIGKLLAKKLVQKGCILILIDIDTFGLEEVSQTLNETFQQQVAYPFKCDISNYDEICLIKKKIVETIGNPTIIINNAGVVAGKYFFDLKPKEIQKTFEVNILSHFWVVQLFLPHMLEMNHGHIVSVASILGLDSFAGVSEYGASKAAAVNFMKSLRQELRLINKNGVHCTTVLPFHTSTDMFKGFGSRFKNFFLLKVLDPDYVAERIIDAVERNQTTLYIPKILYVIITLLSVLPDNSYDVIADFFKVNHSMQSFLGKKVL